MLPVDLMVVGWAVVSSSEKSIWLGRPVYRLTGLEFAVLCAVCTLLHSYLLPTSR